MTLIIILVLTIILLLMLIGIYIYIRHKVRKVSSGLSEIANAFKGTLDSANNTVNNTSSSLQGFRDFFDLIKQEGSNMSSEIKTPYGMDNLLKPEILKDFPNMNIDEMKNIAEEDILLYFKSIETKSLQPIKMMSDKLKEEILSDIRDYNNYDIRVENIDVHKTVINKYEKIGSLCTITFQSSVGYKFSKNGETKNVEERINTEFIYVFNDLKINTNDSISLNCPNCGAPIAGLGHKICPYCKTGLIDLAPKTWKLNDIAKI